MHRRPRLHPNRIKLRVAGGGLSMLGLLGALRGGGVVGGREACWEGLLGGDIDGVGRRRGVPCTIGIQAHVCVGFQLLHAALPRRGARCGVGWGLLGGDSVVETRIAGPRVGGEAAVRLA